MERKTYCIGVDFGTDSVRAMVVDAADGREVSQAVFVYPRWRDGLYCDAASNRFRQHPLDHIEGLEWTVRRCLEEAGQAVRRCVRSISVDTTGSTPVAVDAHGVPLALREPFRDDPDAMFILWKDHTAIGEAAAINEHAGRFAIDYLRYVGGIYSSEWFWAKLLYVLRRNEAVRKACHSWVEHSDWIPFLLTGGTRAADIKRNVCAAGHKALWSAAFGGLPPDGFFAALDPLLAGWRDRLHTRVYTADRAAGTIGAEWAGRLGLPDDVLVGIGAMDAHVGAVGGQIAPYQLSKVMGTSTCDMLVAPQAEMEGVFVRGICGQVDGSIIPGMVGLEAGQSAFGDVYAWFRDLLSWPLRHMDGLVGDTAGIADRLLAELDGQASALPLGEGSEWAVDWFNGRRTPDADPTLKGLIGGLTLGSDAPRLYRALVESTCFGARRIVDRFREEGIPVHGVIGVGGIARKSPFVMQTMADALDIPIRIHRSEQTCALGAAMFAATVAGAHPRVEVAMEAMGQGFDREFTPRAEWRDWYGRQYRRYAHAAGSPGDAPGTWHVS